MIPLLLTILAVLAIGISPVWDYDVWFQLACGKAIVALRSLPEHDLFSFTAAERPWDTQEWLAQILFHSIHAAFGIAGLTVFKAVVVALAFAFVYRDGVAALRLGNERDAAIPEPRPANETAAAWLTMLLCTAGAYTMRWSVVERPQIFTFLFLALELHLLRSRRSPWLIVPLTLLWANLHGGSVLIAPGVLALRTAVEALRRARRRLTPRPFGKPLLVTALLPAVAAVNPSGLRLLLYPFETMRDRMYMLNVREWVPPAPDEQTSFFVLLAAATAAIALSSRRLRAGDLAVSAAFALLALSARRHIPLFVISVIPPLAGAVRHVLSAPLARFPRPTATIALLAAVAIVRTANVRGEALAIGVRQRLYPAGAIEVLRTALPGNVRVFGLHQWGGYLIWNLPERFKIFIDGRQMVYGQRLFADYYRILEDTAAAGELLARYRPDVFVLDYRYSSKLSRRLAAGDGALIYWDDACLVYVARTSRFARAVAQREYRHCHPARSPGPDLEKSLAELDRAAREAPGHSRPQALKASLLLANGRLADARKAAAAALNAGHSPALPALLTAFDVALARQDYGTAEDLLRRARAVDQTGTSSDLARSRLLLARGRPREARAATEKAIRSGERRRKRTGRPELALADAYRMLAAQLLAEGDDAGAGDSLRLAGNALFALRRLDEAAAAYREGKKLAPSDMRLWHNLGTALLEAGEYRPALTEYRRALELAPDHADSRVGAGIALFRLGRLEEAAAEWKEALRLDPDHADARAYLKHLDSRRKGLQ